ncbi:MAG TPA: FAD-dependent oxidoreductase [Conexibacter sp.]|nr:FAD-dependent oxidoreductase [Conexibacter sp.]
MNQIASPSKRRRVVIAGGGIAAVETLLALRSLAPTTQLDVVVVAPNEDLHYRPSTVNEPFSEPRARRYRLQAICDDLGAVLHAEPVRVVDGARREIATASGERIAYDALVLAVGARPRPAIAHAHTFFADINAGNLHGFVRDVEDGYVRALACVVPPKAGWSLPLYELALKTVARARSMGSEGLKLTIVTNEDVPLAAFRGAGSRAVAGLLEAAGIAILCSTYVTAFDGRRLTLAPGGRSLEVDAALALPELHGPALPGVPCDADGFIHADEHGRVPGLDDVYAIGDATTFPIMQGGVATQQADVVAALIARSAGVDAREPRTRPVLRAILLTGDEPLYLTATITGGESVASQASTHCMWWPPHKVAARHLAPYLADRDEAPDSARRHALETRRGDDPPRAHAEGEAGFELLGRDA